MSSPTNGTGPPSAAGAPREVSARLAALTAELWRQQVRGGTGVDVLGPRDQLIAEIPTAVGTYGSLLAVVHRRTPRGSLAVLQVFRPGPAGVRVPISGAILLQGEMLSLLGEAVAGLLALERRQPYRPRRGRERPPDRPAPARSSAQDTAPKAAGAPVSGAAGATHDSVTDPASDPSTGGRSPKEGGAQPPTQTPDDDPLPAWAGGGAPQHQGETP